MRESRVGDTRAREDTCRFIVDATSVCGNDRTNQARAHAWFALLPSQKWHVTHTPPTRSLRPYQDNGEEEEGTAAGCVVLVLRVRIMLLINSRDFEDEKGMFYMDS